MKKLLLLAVALLPVSAYAFGELTITTYCGQRVIQTGQCVKYANGTTGDCETFSSVSINNDCVEAPLNSLGDAYAAACPSGYTDGGANLGSCQTGSSTECYSCSVPTYNYPESYTSCGGFTLTEGATLCTYTNCYKNISVNCSGNEGVIGLSSGTTCTGGTASCREYYLSGTATSVPSNCNTSGCTGCVTGGEQQTDCDVLICVDSWLECNPLEQALTCGGGGMAVSEPVMNTNCFTSLANYRSWCVNKTRNQRQSALNKGQLPGGTQSCCVYCSNGEYCEKSFGDPGTIIDVGIGDELCKECLFDPQDPVLTCSWTQVEDVSMSVSACQENSVALGSSSSNCGTCSANCGSWCELYYYENGLSKFCRKRTYSCQ